MNDAARERSRGARRIRGGDRVVRVASWTALGFVLLPFIVLIIAMVRVGGHFHAVSDQALEELQARDVGRHFAQLGLYSRDNWSHPGPAMFYLLAIPYRLAGGNSVGLWIGAALLNGAAVATMAVVAKRHAGTALMLLTLLGSALVMRTVGASFLRDPWNPYLPVFLFGALIFLVWAMACGDEWAVPVGAAVATFCAQTHIGYAVLALPLFVIGAVWLVVVVRRAREASADRRDHLARTTWITVGVLAVMWFPPLYEELTNSDGNLTKIVRYFRGPPPGPRYTLVHGYRLVASQFAIPPEWLIRMPKLRPLTAEATTLYHAPTPFLLLGFAAAGVLLFRMRRRRGRADRRMWRLEVIVALALILGAFSIARTVGVAFAYRLYWTLVVGMIAAVVVLWAAWRQIAPRASASFRRGLAVVTALAVVVVASVDIVAAATVGSPQQQKSENVARLGKQLLIALPPGRGDVVLFSPDPISGYQQGLTLWLERRGVPARVLPFEGIAYGSSRVHRRRRPLRAVVTVASGSAAAATAALPGAQIIAIAANRPVDELQSRIRQSAKLTRDYLAKTVGDREYGVRNAALLSNLAGVTAVFLQAPIVTSPPRKQRPM
jgi:hypothetical protein